MSFQPMITYGMDPEAFLQRAGKIIGSEKVIPEAGLDFGYVVQDGIQMELHPPQAASRVQLATNLREVFKALKAKLAETKGVEGVFTSVVDVTQDEIDSLSDKSRQWLCQPSSNCWGLKPEHRDAKTYLKRAAGGHFHFGVKDPIYDIEVGEDSRTSLAPLFDFLMGIPGVLLDRDMGQIERRKCYGMAGEFRLPRYGIEYRTLSNFWLRSLPLMSLFAGMGQYAIQILAEQKMYDAKVDGCAPLEDELIAAVGDPGKVINAIQNNDAQLAWIVWRRIQYFLEQHPPTVLGTAGGVKAFSTFARAVQEKGLNTYFPDDPIQHWCNLPTASLNGLVDPWQEFIRKF